MHALREAKARPAIRHPPPLGAAKNRIGQYGICTTTTLVLSLKGVALVSFKRQL